MLNPLITGSSERYERKRKELVSFLVSVVLLVLLPTFLLSTLPTLVETWMGLTVDPSYLDADPLGRLGLGTIAGTAVVLALFLALVNYKRKTPHQNLDGKLLAGSGSLFTGFGMAFFAINIWPTVWRVNALMGLFFFILGILVLKKTLQTAPSH